MKVGLRIVRARAPARPARISSSTPYTDRTLDVQRLEAIVRGPGGGISFDRLTLRKHTASDTH